MHGTRRGRRSVIIVLCMWVLTLIHDFWRWFASCSCGCLDTSDKRFVMYTHPNNTVSFMCINFSVFSIALLFTKTNTHIILRTHYWHQQQKRTTKNLLPYMLLECLLILNIIHVQDEKQQLRTILNSSWSVTNSTACKFYCYLNYM